MFSDNPLLAQLKQQMQANLPKKEGVVKGTDKSFGFLEVDSKTRYFIPPNMMKRCMHGDKIRAIIRTENDKDNAEPEALLEAGLDRFIGRVNRFKGRLNVIPDHPQMKKLSLKAKAINGVKADDLQQDDWVVAHLVQHPLRDDNEQFFVEISHKITDANDKIAPWWVTLAKNDLPNCEPKSLENGENWQVNDDNDLKRVDLTHIPFVTIDGASTKDMDDALFAEMQDDGQIKLTIAIADPTAYITPDSSMDKVARERGFTIYLPGRNIPMLPRDLADDLCSLKQDEQRLALCCDVLISETGDLNEESIHFYAATIQSHSRLIYEHVSDWLDHGQSSDWSPNQTIADVVSLLNTMAQRRRQWRENNAVIFPDRPDYRFELSEDNDVVAIHADMRRSANNLVEEAMITANICAGMALKNKMNMGIFNTHSGFKEEKLDDVLQLIGESQSKEELSTLEGFSKLRRQLMANNEIYLDHRIRKCQNYGEITHQPAPHFAMGLPIYATWTSPIRKYGDMINHRLLKAFILQKTPVQTPDDKIGEALSLCRRFHNAAERHISDWLYTRTLKDAPENGTKFQAEIFDINRAGARVRLLENGAAAFIPNSQIVDDKERIQGQRETGVIEIDGEITYRLGDVLEVQLTEVNQEMRSLVAKPAQTLVLNEKPASTEETTKAESKTE